MIEDTKPYLFVAIGGFAGACMRYIINFLVLSMPGILIINVSGCILLGFLLYESQYSGMFSPATRTFFGAGFIGAFTTF
jgi:CrcB protein